MGAGGHDSGKPAVERSVGHYLGARLSEVGAREAFIVPGDFNMKLLDEMMKADPQLHQIGCCNELNAGYAADGYSRATGLGVLVVTHMVGALSALNAVAGAYAEQSAVVCIVGTLNTNDIGGPHIIHHTLANNSTSDQMIAFREFTCHQERIRAAESAAEQIDRAIKAALVNRRPVLIEVPCNLAGAVHASLAPPVPGTLQPQASNQRSLDAAVAAVADMLHASERPAIVGGPLLKPCKGMEALQALAEQMGCPVAVQFSAKSMFPETHPQFLGVYCAAISSPGVLDRLTSADVIIAAGALMNDMNTVGFTGPLSKERTVLVGPDRITLGGGRSFGCVQMLDFLKALPGALKQRWQEDLKEPPPQPSEPQIAHSGEKVAENSAPFFGFAPAEDPNAPITANALYYHIQNALDAKSNVISDCGDSLFQVAKLRLPEGCKLDMQVQYASIGWSVGATLGLSAAAKVSDRRVFAIIGDGAYQMGPQEISTMMRQRLNPVIIILNNGTYAVEEMIHKGPYNELKVWDYALLARALSNGDGSTFTASVKTEADLVAALKQAGGPARGQLCLLDVRLAPDDCSAELLQFGRDLGAFGSRPPVMSE